MSLADLVVVLSGAQRWTLIHANNTDVLPMLGDKSVAHVITDPPYSRLVVNSAKGAPGDKVGSAYQRDLGYQGISSGDRSRLGLEFGRMCARWCLVFCDAESLTDWRQGLELGGLQHVRMGAWVMPNPTPQFTGDRPGTGWEAAEICHRPGRKRWNGGGLPAVWIHPRPPNGSNERNEIGHPTPKPLSLMLELVELFTDPDDIVLDPFAGSGTTGVACLRLGRRFIGIERDEKYAAVARERLEAESQGLSLRAARAGQIALFGT